MYKLLVRIPFFGIVLKIFNSYAYDGDFRADDRFASLYCWLKAYLFPFLFSIAMASLMMPSVINQFLPVFMQIAYKVEAVPGDISTSIFPSLLGFGIGVYALVFALEKRLVQDLQESFKKTDSASTGQGSALLLNTKMALPLVVIALTLVVAVLQKALVVSVLLNFLAWFSLWLSIYFTVELINTLFMMGEAHLSQSLKRDN
ncbi:hypothetical protein EIG75_11580 [Pseudomonas syringae]|uniref:DUF4013 domain-containing protein n=1 Tax=Pseudomonas syringae TaxID=317 RepID=A0AB37ZG16_PSESX|nr:hypothetical protein [Pseudomonas syringae]AKF52752.1 hypothetical protein PsyrH_20095 [Pseudomonas syringae pv. syringae HS191]MBI6667379.1 hypothetical protein [Pseudomonas syringae]MBI6675980.1 hypothetical protein [Pseudomonas syringae]MBI6840105.1 hypothetical protein [Pseudomonas syringae]MDC6489731.1 hypothetical protein [Pseudomonas syringae]